MKKAVSFILCLALIFFSTTLPLSAEEPYGKVYCRNTNCKGKIALTFDDGPHPRYTKEILAILEEYHVTATFFIIGVNAENYPADLQRIIDAGCEIGNHTYSHLPIKKLSEDALQKEIVQCEDTIYKLSGVRPCIFRPPEGMMNDALKGLLSQMQYHIVLWSIDTMDWALTPSSEIYQNVTKKIHSGDIILMHDYVSGGNTTCKALRLIIPELLARGYEVVTVSELIQGDHE